MKKKYAGYIHLEPLNGVIYPSSIQNILMKNFIEETLRGIFYLSPTELLQSKYAITLNTLISKDTKISGIVMLSSFMLPKSFAERNDFYTKFLRSKKKIFFILDELSLEKKEDIRKIENFIIFNSKFFTETKKQLDKYQKSFMKKFIDVCLV